MRGVWEMYQDLMTMYETKEELEKEIARVMSDPQLIAPSEKSSRLHDRLEAIAYLDIKVYAPFWNDIGMHPPPRSSKKSWI